MNLLTYGKSVTKIKKSDEAKLGYNTAILYLAPAKTSGFNMCPNASPGCIASCLFTAGRGKCYHVQRARVRKTRLFHNNRKEFLDLLTEDINKFIRKCHKLNLRAAIRLNGTSDIPWEKYLDLSKFDCMFYDYTKSTKRMQSYIQGKMSANYHLTFSRSELNEQSAINIRRAGGNVAVVFHGYIPAKWKRFRVFNGDSHDLRFLDPKGICGLTAKGKAKKDTTGFVVGRSLT